MLHYSKKVVNDLGASRRQDKRWCQWNKALLRDSLLSENIDMMGFSYSMVSNEIGPKSSVMDVGNWVISDRNPQRNRQANPMLMACLVHSRVLILCCP